MQITVKGGVSLNTAAHTSSLSPASAVPGIQAQLGAGTFLVSRQYTGNCTARDLLRQRVQQASHAISSIDGEIGTTV